jgi:hypothetical protein
MTSRTMRVSTEAYEILQQLAAEMTIHADGKKKHTVADALDALIETQLTRKARLEVVSCRD